MVKAKKITVMMFMAPKKKKTVMKKMAAMKRRAMKEPCRALCPRHLGEHCARPYGHTPQLGWGHKCKLCTAMVAGRVQRTFDCKQTKKKKMAAMKRRAMKAPAVTKKVIRKAARDLVTMTNYEFENNIPDEATRRAWCTHAGQIYDEANKMRAAMAAMKRRAKKAVIAAKAMKKRSAMGLKSSE